MKIALTNFICKRAGAIFFDRKGEGYPKKSLLFFLTLNYSELPILIR